MCRVANMHGGFWHVVNADGSANKAKGRVDAGAEGDAEDPGAPHGVSSRWPCFQPSESRDAHGLQGGDKSCEQSREMLGDLALRSDSHDIPR
jgi:hypothetical protein